MNIRNTRIELSNLFVLVLTLSIAIFSSLSVVHLNNKVKEVRLKGEPILMNQIELINSIQASLDNWIDQIDGSVIKENELKVKIDQRDFNLKISKLTSNQNFLSQYMLKWNLNLKKTSGHNEILKFLYANPVERIEAKKGEVSEKLFLKRKITDFHNMFSFYKQMILHENEKIHMKINSQENLKIGLIFISFTSLLVFILFSFYSYSFYKGSKKLKSKFNVLFVDDDKEILEVLSETSHALKNCNFLQAGDGLEALGVLKSRKIDLIVTDLSMPNMGGVELIQKIEKLQVPVIVMTSRDILSIEARRLLKGQHIYDKFDFLCRMDQIIGLEIGKNAKGESFRKVS